MGAQSLVTMQSVDVVDAASQTTPLQAHDTIVQTDLSAVHRDLIVAADFPPVAPTNSQTPQERKLELATEFGVELSALERFVEAQKTPRMAPAMASGLHFRRAGRWASRIGSRAAVQGPALIINVSDLIAVLYSDYCADTRLDIRRLYRNRLNQWCHRCSNPL
jgi:hypothetical protein